jgi:hypothetical protein
MRKKRNTKDGIEETCIEHAERHDGKFNVWRKVDLHHRDQRPPRYGSWAIVGVYASEEEALKAVDA